eukprot:TRINITY_DN7699_c0_g1_i1.p1 TRINITY_DN7699_c0_g1~~TRINITY_DN7699_c0_g1_i1.p1  ORF type:complete len:442 (+),score=78.85 TRINITY_DN7699_c0_g1_i1:38-1327(+)
MAWRGGDDDFPGGFLNLTQPRTSGGLLNLAPGNSSSSWDSNGSGGFLGLSGGRDSGGPREGFPLLMRGKGKGGNAGGPPSNGGPLEGSALMPGAANSNGELPGKGKDKGKGGQLFQEILERLGKGNAFLAEFWDEPAKGKGNGEVAENSWDQPRIASSAGLNDQAAENSWDQPRIDSSAGLNDSWGNSGPAAASSEPRPGEGRAAPPRKRVSRFDEPPADFLQGPSGGKGQQGPLRKRPRFRETACAFFAQNACKNGEFCTFSHDPNLIEEAVMSGRIDPSAPAHPRTTTPCKFFLTGSCKKTDCPFSHDPDAINAAVSKGTLTLDQLYGATQKQEVPCKFFMSGKCRNETSCPFSHDVAVIAAAQGLGTAAQTPKLTPAEAAKYKMEICRFFDKGGCSRGAMCIYAHGVSELRNEPLKMRLLAAGAAT